MFYFAAIFLILCVLIAVGASINTASKYDSSEVQPEEPIVERRPTVTRVGVGLLLGGLPGGLLGFAFRKKVRRH